MKKNKAYYRKLLQRIVVKSEIDDWLDKPNPAFNGRTPNDLIKSGEGNKLEEMVQQAEENVAN